MDNQDQWQPSASLNNLQLRADILKRLRQYFAEHDFWEVHTPVLSRDVVLDRHIDPVVLPGHSLGLSTLQHCDFYLQTSPEFAMKRLIAAGAKRIYQISQVFRSGERGRQHNPEFTMVEWYRVGDGLSQAIGLLGDIIRSALPESTITTTTYRDAFQLHVGLCPLESPVEVLAKAAVDLDLSVDLNWSSDRDDWLNLLVSEVVQPKLGQKGPEIMTHYPASQSALACISPADRRVAERFELFFRGVELANGYHELLDESELSARNELVSEQRAHDGKAPLPKTSRLQQAMREGLADCSGCALGLDRLLMVACQASTIDEVICFPIEMA